LADGGRRFSLSQRERAGVRGKGRYELPSPHPPGFRLPARK
jgi:hypothetical protein